MGVETSPGEYDLTGCVMSTSKVGFEWCIQSAEEMRREIVTPSYNDAIRQGVPAPDCGRRVSDCGRRVSVPGRYFEDAASEAARHGQALLRDKLGRKDLDVSCNFLGVVVSDGFDKCCPVLKDCKVGFEWVLLVPEWDWKETAFMRVKHVDYRDVPLPRCAVIRQKLVNVAQQAAQHIWMKYGIEASCTCPCDSW